MLYNTDRAEIAESCQDQIEKTRIKEISTIGVAKFGAGKFAQSGREIAPGVGISNWIQRATKALPSCDGKDQSKQNPITGLPKRRDVPARQVPACGLRNHFQGSADVRSNSDG